MNKFKTRMELSCNRSSDNLAYTQYITYKYKITKGIKRRYKKDGEILSATMCPKYYLKIDLPHWKCVCSFCQHCLPLYLYHEETI